MDSPALAHANDQKVCWTTAKFATMKYDCKKLWFFLKLEAVRDGLLSGTFNGYVEHSTVCAQHTVPCKAWIRPCDVCKWNYDTSGIITAVCGTQRCFVDTQMIDIWGWWLRCRRRLIYLWTYRFIHVECPGVLFLSPHRLTFPDAVVFC